MNCAISSCDDQNVCQISPEKIFDKDLGAPLSMAVDDVGLRMGFILTALRNLHRKLYTGGANEENREFAPEVENSMAASIAEIYKILAECEATMDEIFKKL